MSALTNLDALILAQAVFELGGNSWSDVAKLLSKHPLLSHPKSFFTPQSCQAFYEYLRKEASLEITEEDAVVRAPLNLKLAKIRYQARYSQLRELIGEEEEKFKRIWNEIEIIRNGQSAGIQPESKVRMLSPVTPSRVEEGATQLDMEDAVEPTSSTALTSTVEVESPPGKDSPSAAVSGPEPAEGEGGVGSSDIAEIQTQDREQEATQKTDDDTSSLSNAPSPPAIQIDDLFEPETEENEDPSQQQTLDHAESVTESAQDMEVEPEEPEPQHAPTETDGPSEMPAETPAKTPERAVIEDRPAIERTPEPVSAEGESSGDEPLNVQKNRKGSRRGKSSATAARAAKARRRRKSSAAVEIPPADQDQDDGKHELGTGSPEPEGTSGKRQGKRTASVLEEHDTRDKKRARDGSEPAEEEDIGSISPSAARARRRADAQTPAKKFQNVIGMLHSQISQHRNGTIFHNPIRDSEAPDYHDIVKRPMDLKTVKTKVRDGVITNSLEFQRDIYLMFANAMMYNRPGSDVYVMAEDMMLDCEDYIQTFRQTEGFLRGSQR